MHSFHIPVLGLGFSIDTPIKVARFGISSVISIIEDELLDDLRRHYSGVYGVPFTPIREDATDARARRITAYLNLVNDIVQAQLLDLKLMPFEPDSDLTRYFELLPEDAPGKKMYLRMLALPELTEKQDLQLHLRKYIVAGSIDVNIMAKVDNPRYTRTGERLPDEFSDALSALRGFANSELTSSVVFSAGYNPRLYNYAEQFDDFYPDENGLVKKKIILKVSDYRSALVQGKIFAKKGLWISEFRIESGLNCGGHAFATDGLLMGPILENFRENRTALTKELYTICNEALTHKGRRPFRQVPQQKLTAQGGVGTAQEHRFLLDWYQLDSVGWGSPFLLVPEATNVDEATLAQLASAKKEDFFLSNASPLGVPFHNFRHSSSEAQRKTRIEKKRPGSPCYKKYLSSNTEFTELPICTASRQYQNLKEKQLRDSGLNGAQLEIALEKIGEKDCLCEGLTASVRLKNEIPIPHKMSAVAICPGPNLAYFSGVFTLKQMVDHIYGRTSIRNSLERAHMFINELGLYIDYLRNQIAECGAPLTEKQKKHFALFKTNLQQGIEYYKSLPATAQSKMQLIRLDSQLAQLVTG